jgi:hypothetical protein
MNRSNWRFVLAVLVAAIVTSNAAADQDPDNQISGEAKQGFQWRSALLQSFLAFSIAHAERFPTEKGTRHSIHGPFWKNYWHDVQNIHGWEDGDGFLTSYIAHPMEGAMAGYIQRQNDPKYRNVEFGTTQRYWNSVLRSLAFSTLYNVAWSLSPYGEAGLGNVDTHAPPGLVDPVGSEMLGTAWLVGEDAVDRYLIRRIEDRYQNTVIRAFARGGLNPIRSYSNMLRLKVPWYRDSRSLYAPRHDAAVAKKNATEATFKADAWPNRALELLGQPYVQRNFGPRGSTCAGGGGEGATRIGSSLALVFTVDGCTLLGLHAPDSGDMLNYLAGPRWTLPSSKHWIPDVQILAGGAKITRSHLDAAKKAELVAIAAQKGDYPSEDEYVTEIDTNGFTVRAGGGLSYQMNEMLVLRVVNLAYQHSWVSTLQDSTYTNGLRFSFGLAVRFGQWREER